MLGTRTPHDHQRHAVFHFELEELIQQWIDLHLGMFDPIKGPFYLPPFGFSVFKFNVVAWPCVFNLC